MRRFVALALVATTVLGACSEKDKGEEEQGAPTEACPAASPAMSTAPTLPANFPSPSETTYTSSSKAGPSTLVMAYFADDLDGAYNTYKSAFESASGYTLTKSEHDPRDAELDWSGQSTTGEVKMDWPCKGRTELTITIRPS